MQTFLKVLSYLGKGLGFAVALDWTSISPSIGPIIFFASSLAKDTINRIGDFLDDGQVNQSFGK